MTNRKKYILDSTEESHWYLFPEEKKEEFDELLSTKGLRNGRLLKNGIVPVWLSVMSKDISLQKR